MQEHPENYISGSQGDHTQSPAVNRAARFVWDDRAKGAYEAPRDANSSFFGIPPAPPAATGAPPAAGGAVPPDPGPPLPPPSAGAQGYEFSVSSPPMKPRDRPTSFGAIRGGEGTRGPAVLCFDYPGEAFLESVSRVTSVSTYDSSARQLDGLMRQIESQVSIYGSVLAVYPRVREQTALRALKTARTLLGGASLVAYGAVSAPLAGGPLCALAGALAPRVESAAALAAAVPALERQLLSMAWLHSLNGLESPAPTIWQHLCSFWPGTAFAVTAWPAPNVKRLTQRDSAVPLPTVAEEIGVGLSSLRGDRNWVEREVLRPLGFPGTKEVEPTALSRHWWGAKRFAELVVYPLDVERVARTVLASQGAAFECAWCGDRIADLACTACGYQHAEGAGIVPEEFAGQS